MSSLNPMILSALLAFKRKAAPHRVAKEAPEAPKSARQKRRAAQRKARKITKRRIKRKEAHMRG